MEELEESVCSVVRQENEREDQGLNGKVYSKVVRPALMYGAETLALKKAQEKKLEVAEIRMLRWMCGDTKLDKIRNERIYKRDNESGGNQVGRKYRKEG